MSQELLPCPFCGSSDVVRTFGDINTYTKSLNKGNRPGYVTCNECGAEAGHAGNGPEDKGWNRRVAPQAQGAGKWGPDDVVGYTCDQKPCSHKMGMDDMEHGMHTVFFEELLPEVQAALTSAQERDMTPEEALAEAKKRWGPDGWINMFSENEDGSLTYEVGYGDDSEDGRSVNFLGHGISFRAAFASADRAAKEKP